MRGPFGIAPEATVRVRRNRSNRRDLGELLIGRDPSNPEELWNLMYDATDYIDRRGIVMHAIGGIDLALWDIKAELENKPIAELLGGVHRDRVEANGTIYPMARTVAGVEAQVGDALNRMRLHNIKFAADPQGRAGRPRAQ